MKFIISHFKKHKIDLLLLIPVLYFIFIWGLKVKGENYGYNFDVYVFNKSDRKTVNFNNFIVDDSVYDINIDVNSSELLSQKIIIKKNQKIKFNINKSEFFCIPKFYSFQNRCVYEPDEYRKLHCKIILLEKNKIDCGCCV